MKYEKRDLKGSNKLITFHSFCIAKLDRVLILYFVKEKPDRHFRISTFATTN